MSAKLNPVAEIENRILAICGQKVILDKDLAALYGVETRVLNQAVKDEIRRISQIVTSFPQEGDAIQVSPAKTQQRIST